MLVLSRKARQRVFLSGNIIVEVVDIQGGKVRLGFTAPDSVVIQREELLDELPPPKKGGGR